VALRVETDLVDVRGLGEISVFWRGRIPDSGLDLVRMVVAVGMDFVEVGGFLSDKPPFQPKLDILTF